VNPTLGIPHYDGCNGFLTVSGATAKEEGTDGGVRGLQGALFWISSATLAILRR